MDNELSLFEKARKSKILLNGAWATILFFLMSFIGQLIGGMMIVFIGSFLVGPERVVDQLDNIQVLLWVAMFPIIPCFIWIKAVEKRKISSIGLDKTNIFRKFFKGFGIGILLFSSVTFLMYIFGVITMKQGTNMGIKSFYGLIIILPGWIVQSSAEEILSRGWLMHVVGAKHKPLIGLFVSSMVFGFLHILNPGVNILSILNVVLVGFLFGLYVIYTQDLWAVCGMHAAWNFSQGNLFGFSVSGLEANTRSLVKFSSAGSDLLTGGAFGPEASVFTTVILSAASIILVLKLRKAKIVSLKFSK